ncbi:hypothetical protein [Streptomyces spectabilis]|uniref:Phage gp6-like head-tail connector protein n=1 Tax=Streptomyces spectabilis TaxID=68270 RepID=A0A5P2X477_STRST|nr:hypothetical protein [Streptomyces spectabilis]MBB5103290.1 hypothetical protein [Streptomyces spectabilis]MCI3902480.1 hypothetical protein [Streptomyces spectabilis]QEV59817.1 hypothetical protein CP982_14600 [Streptomyces spectabilis]GGV13605.1 hypothetical protein GCM10010245_23740 [Streptomyces spectabilis]
MALAPLATVADLEARGLAIAAEEVAVVGVYLEEASAAVREAAGVPISQTTSTLTLEGPDDSQWLHLPGPPIQAVASVAIDGQTVTDWKLTAHKLWRANGWRTGCEPSDVEVVQTHGLPTVPADLVGLVCRIAAAVLVHQRAQPDGEGLAAKDIRSERIGDYSVTYGDSGRITDIELPDYLREQLAARFGGGATLVRSR